VKKKDDAYFLSSTEYKNTKGEPFNTSNSGIIMHCMNHSTFHRGQLVTMLRGLGYEGAVDSTDLISYLRVQ
ncbi:MAG: DinB family protein, partial [Bacteroidia bacterium]